MYRLKGEVIGAAMEVHKILGPGLLERAYRDCLAKELERRGLRVEMEVPHPIVYKGERVEHAYVVDLVIEDALLVELKAVDHVHPQHIAQLRTYLAMRGAPEGLLINFNVPILKNGLFRVCRHPKDQRDQASMNVPSRPRA